MMRDMLAYSLIFLTILSGAIQIAAEDSIEVAVLHSETNANEYHGLCQSNLEMWLKEAGLHFKLLGDKQAAQMEELNKFPLVVATNTYLLPDNVATALVGYVKNGGKLLWFDAPARVRHKEFLDCLGISPRFSYSPIKNARFIILRHDHPVCAGLVDFIATSVGNPALSEGITGDVLIEWRGRRKGGQDFAAPALIVNHYGDGQTLLFNFIPWMTEGTEPLNLITAGIQWILAPELLKRKEAATWPSLLKRSIEQPEPVAVQVHLLVRKKYAGESLTLEGRLRCANRTAKQKLNVKLMGKGNAIAAVSTIEFDTTNMPDGTGIIELAVRDREGKTLCEGKVQVELIGLTMKRLRDDDDRRYELLKSVLPGTLGDYDAELRDKDGRFDIERMMKAIKNANMNMYDFLIWHDKNDWNDLQRFLPVAQKAGLKAWVTICPPSEQGPRWPWSEPFRLDFIRWAEEIGKLSKRYPCISAYVIDDFWSGSNRQLYTPKYIAKMVTKLYEQNPNVAFLPTIYWGTVGDKEWIKQYGPLIDGIVFPYSDTRSAAECAKQLKAIRKWLGPKKYILVNVYASGGAGGPDTGPRTPEYMREMLETSWKLADGIRIYCLPKKDLTDYRYRITAELYGKFAKESKQ